MSWKVWGFFGVVVFFVLFFVFVFLTKRFNLTQ